MNRYLINGLVADAEAGRTIIVVGSGVGRHQAYRAIRRTAVGRIAHADTAHGILAITFIGGGTITLVPGANSATLKGRSADIVLLASPYATRPDLYEDATIAVHTSPHGEVILA